MQTARDLHGYTCHEKPCPLTTPPRAYTESPARRGRHPDPRRDDGALTPGPAVLVVEIGDRRSTTSKVVIPVGTTLEVTLTAGRIR